MRSRLECAALCLAVMTALMATGCSAMSESKPASPRESTERPAACHADIDCPDTHRQCTTGVCRDGACEAMPVDRGTRCQLDRQWAQRQADLFPIEKNQLGVCAEGMCMPRLLCMQRCGGALARAVEKTVTLHPCPPSTTCNPAPDPQAVARAKDGLSRCVLSCGYPPVDPYVPPKPPVSSGGANRSATQ
jgi:hypothetical protein